MGLRHPSRECNERRLGHWAPAALAWALAVLAAGRPARALIRVEFPVSKIHEAAKAVLVGTVETVRPDSRVVEVRVDEAVKGPAPGERLRLQVLAPAEVFANVAPGGRAVLFAGETDGKPVAVVHLADTWLLASGIPGAQVPAWRIVQPYDAARSFPGRTAGLVRVLGELKAGRPTLRDAVEPDVFRGGPSRLADVLPGASFLLAPDLTGDGLADVLAGNDTHVQLFINKGGGLADATAAWGLAGARGAWAAAGDLDGDARADLVLGGALWLNAGGALRPAGRIETGGTPLAAAVADLNADRKADLALLLADGTLRVFENPGAPGGQWKALAPRRLWSGGEKALAAALSPDWGDDGRLHALVVTANGIVRYALDPSGGPPADHARLTGQPMGGADPKGAGRWEVLAAAALDLDGDGRQDFLVLTADGGEALANRGFGAFLANPDAVGPIHGRGGRKAPWGKPARGMLLAAGDLCRDRFDDLLLLLPDGRLFELINTHFDN